MVAALVTAAYGQKKATVWLGSWVLIRPAGGSDLPHSVDSDRIFCPPTHRRPQRLLRLGIQGHVAHERQGGFQAHVPVLQQRDAELPILLPRSHSLGEEQVENVQTVGSPRFQCNK